MHLLHRAILKFLNARHVSIHAILKKWEKTIPGDGLHAFCRHIPIISIIGLEVLVKVRLYCGNIDA